jgi:hypothetical protein
MISNEVYAVLAAAAYFAKNENKIALPPGWSEIDRFPAEGAVHVKVVVA